MTNRFVGFSVITAGMNCNRTGFAPALLQFGLLSGAHAYQRAGRKAGFSFTENPASPIGVNALGSITLTVV